MPELTFTGTPDWWGGQKGVIQNVADRAHQVTTVPFEKYPNTRVASFSPMQEQSFDLGRAEATNPVYPQLFERSTGAITNALGQDISGQLQPFIDRGVSNPTENAQSYMNPYNQQVIENIGRLGSRNLTENILPNINDQFIRAGSYGSSGGPGSRSHQDITGRANRDNQKAVTTAQANALQGGYNKALETSVGQQERNLQAGRLLGNARGEDIQRQILGGRELQNLSSQQQGERRQNIGLLGQLGGVQQQQAQQGLNTGYADWQTERNYPYLQAARQNELVRGLTPGQYTSNTASYMPQAPQASPWSQGGGLLAGLIGAANQRQGFAEGGPVDDHKRKSVAHLRHYADGGSVPLSPIQRGVNDAMDTSEIQSMRNQANKLEQMQTNPFWASIARTGYSLASKRTPGVLANLGEAANEGMNEYQGQLNNQTNRELQASNLRGMIDNTLRWQSERNRQHDFDKEKFMHTKNYDARKLGMEEEKLGMDRQLHKLKLSEGIEGGESKEEKAVYKKSDQESLNDNRLSIRTSDKIIKTLEKLKEVNKRLKTGTGVQSAYEVGGGYAAEKIGAGDQSDINLFNSLTKKLALLQEGAQKSGNSALGRLAIISGTKPDLSNDTKGNNDIIDDQLRDIIGARDRAKDITDNLKLSGKNKLHAVDLESKYDDWLESGKPGKFKDFIRNESPKIESPSIDQDKSSLDSPELEEFKEAWIQKAGSLDAKFNGLT